MSSCKLDIGGGIIDNPKKIEPILLKDRYDENITLTDHNEDGVDYIASDEIELYNGTMKIEPGVTIEFADGASIIVGIEGKIDAVGTSGEPIRMIAKTNEPSWAGIYINTNKSNKLHYVQIENAGAGEEYGVYNENAAAITIDGKVSIENTTISKSGDVGVKINDGNASDITSFSGNTIKSCKNFPILTNINYVGALELSNNVFNDNGINMIGIEDTYSDRLNVNTDLEGLEIPYFIQGQFELYANLTLGRGVEFVMDENSVLLHVAGDDYRFEIKGTENEHVVIRGLESENGYWQGIFITSENSGNVFEYLDISDGGGKALTYANAKANISIEQEGKLELNNSTSARSGSCEVLLSNFGGSKYEFINNSPAITKVCEE
ncbi:hypothetical protein GCM10007940_43270 [Portibacter lacus]|uniref:Right handed beta helix domain-containing protein n=2 Tax=Portibacter lacus TaxID=1099794 RepID=A0AA37SRW4_9BACT|nr:hypothetical protein GCM10007940_43270 [Portibacter lacus]